MQAGPRDVFKDMPKNLMPQVIRLNTIAELRAAAPAWNDLWQRSDCTSPLAQAEPIADWLAHFAPASRFQALIVAGEDRWLAALPLVEHRMAGVLRAGVLPCNAWPSGATLLWDAAATDDPNVAVALSAGRARLPWPLVFLEAAMPARASWQALVRALTAADMPCDLRTRWHVGRLAIEHDWPAAFGRLSRKHRQRMAASLRKLADRGEVRFELHAHLSPARGRTAAFAGPGRRKTAAGRARPERRCCERPARRSSCSPRPAGWPRKVGCGWPFSIAAGGTWLSATGCSARESSIRSRSATIPFRAVLARPSAAIPLAPGPACRSAGDGGRLYRRDDRVSRQLAAGVLSVRPPGLRPPRQPVGPCGLVGISAHEGAVGRTSGYGAVF